MCGEKSRLNNTKLAGTLLSLYSTDIQRYRGKTKQLV
ncbi:hypothetical protein LSPH24S_06957 [Lysinibacillus sphaericus]